MPRIPMFFASLGLIVSPFGCGSDGQPSVDPQSPASPAVAEGKTTAQTPPSVAAEPVPLAPVEATAPSLVEAPSTLDPALLSVDREVRQTVGNVKEGVGDLKATAVESANQTIDGVKALGDKTIGSVEQAADEIKGGVRGVARDAQGKVRDAEVGVKNAVQGAKDEMKQRAKALKNDARKAAGAALDNLLGSPN
ncbi:hypothetical protein P12x_003346 [Tundrisphaera lichenicola]|uniref:hypothetical protein n=1 Tax=Tundrisphaera lichenicola TaxID=2029860 RepID=UPI003EB93BB5